MTTNATPTETMAGTTSPRDMALKALVLYEATCLRTITWGTLTPNRCLNGAARTSVKSPVQEMGLSALSPTAAVADSADSLR
jgi:hypothetical protein